MSCAASVSVRRWHAPEGRAPSGRYRNCDEVLGRMNGVDPMSTEYSSLTPYNYSFNNPAEFVDVNGANPWDSGPYAGSELYYYSTQGPDGRGPGQVPLQVQDPFYSHETGWTTVTWEWDPLRAGGYGVNGEGVPNDSWYAGRGYTMLITQQYNKWYHTYGDKSLEKKWTATVFHNEDNGKGRHTKGLFSEKFSAKIDFEPQGGYYNVNQVLQHYGYDSREEYLFPKPSFLERVFGFLFLTDREDLLQKMGEAGTDQWGLVNQNLGSVHLKDLKRYESDLVYLRWQLMTKVERIDDQISKLRLSNPLGVNNNQIRSQTLLKWDILDELIPVNFEIIEVNKAITTKKIM